MAESAHEIRIATNVVKPLMETAPESLKRDPKLWATACLLVRPAIEGIVDPNADDFGAQAITAVQGATAWQLHHEGAEATLNVASQDPTRMEFLRKTCQMARIMGVQHG